MCEALVQRNWVKVVVVQPTGRIRDWSILAAGAPPHERTWE